MRWPAAIVVILGGLPLLCGQGRQTTKDDRLSHETADLLAAAAKGQTKQAQSLLDAGAPVDARDKSGRTPLMLAAQHGHAETVRLLLSKGAAADARDEHGWTAYGLALLDPAGRGDHEEVLKLLPKPARPRLAVDATWTTGGLTSSCFMNREQLAKQIGNIHLDGLLGEEFNRFATLNGKNLVELVPTAENADAVLTLDVQPGVACNRQSDALTLSIVVHLVRAKDREPILDKTFRGGLRGMHMETVSNENQYAPVYDAWIKPQAGPIYWEIVSALYRSQ